MKSEWREVERGFSLAQSLILKAAMKGPRKTRKGTENCGSEWVAPKRSQGAPVPIRPTYGAWAPGLLGTPILPASELWISREPSGSNLFLSVASVYSVDPVSPRVSLCPRRVAANGTRVECSTRNARLRRSHSRFPPHLPRDAVRAQDRSGGEKTTPRPTGSRSRRCALIRTGPDKLRSRGCGFRRHLRRRRSGRIGPAGRLGRRRR